MTGPDHPRFRDDVGAYLLGALTDDERTDFELHMEGCPDCREEAEQLRMAVDALPRSVEQIDPPESLKQSLMKVVEEESSERGVEHDRRRRESRLRRIFTVPRGLRPVIAAGLLVIGLGIGFGVSQIGGTEQAKERTIADQVGARRVPVNSVSLQLEGKGEDGGLLRTEGLPALGPDRVYQTWIQRGNAFLPEPTFIVGTNGVGAVTVPDDLSGATAVLVTREPRGGSKQPTETPVLQVKL